VQLTLSSKGQIVLPAALRRSLRLRPRAKLEAEERDGGIFLRPAVRPKKIESIEYLPPGAIKLTQRECEMMDALAGEDDAPDFS
jgi:AbrB family looped-hinge helix DNA binding protein